jgi:hypothetical protein
MRIDVVNLTGAARALDVGWHAAQEVSLYCGPNPSRGVNDLANKVAPCETRSAVFLADPILKNNTVAVTNVSSIEETGKIHLRRRECSSQNFSII